MEIRLNDERRTVPPEQTLQGLMRELGLAERNGVAVAINDCVISRSKWSECKLAEADRVLLIQATQGG
jgi:sulfur carrier protein